MATDDRPPVPRGDDDILDAPPAPGAPNGPPALDSLTPDYPDDPHPRTGFRASRDPATNRLESEMRSGRWPTEPVMTVLGGGPRAHLQDKMRDLARFALVSRLLFKGRKNAEIQTALREAGHPLGERALQRLLARTDFQDYYSRYRQQLMAPLDQKIREEFRLAMPEAFMELVRVMRQGKPDKVRLEAATTILRGGGGLREEKLSREFVVNVPPEVMRELLDAGRRVARDATPAPALDAEVAEPADAPASNPGEATREGSTPSLRTNDPPPPETPDDAERSDT